MIIPEKSEPVASSSPSTVTTSPSPILSTPYNPAIMAKLNPKATAVDAQSMISQEPPPYSEAGPSSLAGPPPEVVRPRYLSPPRHPSQGSSQSPSDRTHFHPQYLAKRDVASPEASLAPPLGPSHTLRPSSSHTQLPPIDPQAQAHSQRRRQSLPDSARNAGALVLRQNAPPIPRATFPPPSSLPSLPPPSPGPISSPLGQRCNFYSEHKKSSSLKGIYHLDLGLEIPEAVRPPTTSFHGFWNEMDKKSVRAREKEQKAREKAAKGGWGWKKVVVEPLPEKRLANQGVRPNLMLASKDGGVQAEVNVSPGPRRELATIVAESHDGSVKLTVNDPTGQPLRIFAISMDGSVRVRIPPTFQGAIWMTTEDGSVHISEGVQSRMMVFSQSTKTARCYIGDWQSTQFGRASSNPSSPDQSDPFKTWTGPLAHIYARDGSVHISLTGEDTSSTFTKAMKSIYHGIVGVAHEDEEGKQRREQWSHQLQNDPRMVWQARSLEAMPPRMGLTGLVPPKETH